MRSISRTQRTEQFLLSKDRGGTEVFADRAQKNLDHVVQQAAAGTDIHPVTQAVCCLLAFIVFPWETNAFDIVKSKKLPVLTQAGWPRWAITGPRRIITLGELMYVLRNSISHGAISFDSDSRVPADVTIQFVHTPDGAKEPDCHLEIRADQLIEFCRKFTSEMKGQVS